MGVNVPSVRRSGDTMRGNLTVNKTGTGARLAAINGADADRGFIAGTEPDRVIVGTNSAAYHLDLVVDSNTKARIDTNFERQTVIKNGSTLYPAFDCRAWVSFNGTGTVAIRVSGNVSSITDRGTGAYTVNFASPMPDNNYGFSATAGSPTANTGAYAHMTNGGSPTEREFPVDVITDGGTRQDASFISVEIFR